MNSRENDNDVFADRRARRLARRARSGARPAQPAAPRAIVSPVATGAAVAALPVSAARELLAGPLTGPAGELRSLQYELRRAQDKLAEKSRECASLAEDVRRVSARSAVGYSADLQVRMKHGTWELSSARRQLDAVQAQQRQSLEQNAQHRDRERALNAARRFVYHVRLLASRRVTRAFFELKLHSVRTESHLEATCVAAAQSEFRTRRLRIDSFVRLVGRRAARRMQWALDELSRARLASMRSRFLALYGVRESMNHRRLLRIALRGHTSRLGQAWRIWEKTSRKEGAKFQIHAVMRRQITAKQALLKEHRSRILRRALAIALHAKLQIPLLRMRAWTTKTNVVSRALRKAANSARRLKLAGLRLRWAWWVHSAHHAYRHALHTRHALELHQAKTVILSLEDQIDFQHAEHHSQLMQFHRVQTLPLTHDEKMTSHLKAVDAHLNSAEHRESAARTRAARVESAKMIEEALPMDIPPPPPRHHSMLGRERGASERSSTFAGAVSQFGGADGDLLPPDFHDDEGASSTTSENTFNDDAPPPF